MPVLRFAVHKETTMLRSLHIQNYALIDTLDISFTSGFSVITGETGAGKSIILGALGLLLGQRAELKAIKEGKDKCIVEATFNLSGSSLKYFFEENDLVYEEEECILRRELYATGKSRAFINDSPASLTLLKTLGEQLVDIHSQHKNLLLSHEDFQREILDILAHDERELAAYRQSYQTYKAVSKSLNEAVAESEQNKQDEDYVRFQLRQLEEAELEKSEQENLQREADMLNHAEEIKSNVFKACQLISSDEGGFLGEMRECLQTLEEIRTIYPAAEPWIARLESCQIDLQDLQRDLRKAEEEVEFNPARLGMVNDRLNLIYSLEQKHRVDTVEKLLNVADEYRSRLEKITSSDERIEVLKQEKETAYKEMVEQAGILTKERTKAARKIEEQLRTYLIPLGIPHVRFAVEMKKLEVPEMNGSDSVNFLFSANKNVALQEVASIASGGEIARLMLSLKAMIAGAVRLPTIIFDEIDTGISGSIAEKMALMMQAMGAPDRQVISITHLPQIAAKGAVHYKVYKVDTEVGAQSHIVRLNDEERVEEIAHMLSGATMTEEAVDNAKALLGYTKHKRK